MSSLNVDLPPDRVQVTPAAALPTATVLLQKTRDGPTLERRVFFDQGAQKSFITRRLQKELALEPVALVPQSVGSGFGHMEPLTKYELVKVHLILGNRRGFVMAHVVEELNRKIHAPGLLQAADLLRSHDHPLADNITSDSVTDVELLIGGDYYTQFLYGQTNLCGVNVINSAAGYLIFGPVCSETSSLTSQVNSVIVARIATESPPVDHRIDAIEDGCLPVHKLWDLEAVGINATAPSPQDEDAYQSYLNSLLYLDKYYARLPWKRDHDPLPHNYGQALGQLHALTSSLRRKPQQLECYHQIIQDQLASGFIERVESPKVHDKCHYLPHHAVSKPSSTTPLRVVFNCSAKAAPHLPSLNDCLMKGPSMTEDLVSILLRFRTNKYAFSADISKAFLRIGLQEVDRDFTRFLWVENPNDPSSKLITYRFAVVLFGATSSPFLLQATLDHHLRSSKSPYKDYLSTSFYVDNMVNSVNDESTLLEIYEHANQELARANMPLRQWVSNNANLQSVIRENDLGTESAEVNILGLLWNSLEDTLHVRSVPGLERPDHTKRTLLSAVSSLFDPLGFFSPINIRGRKLLQEAWRLKFPWDEILPSDLASQWPTIAADLNQLHQFSLPRSVCQMDLPAHLVVFSDSSERAYGAVAYVVTNGDSNLLMSRARVTPLKSRTLPQLELTAIQFGVQLAHYVRRTLTDITFNQVTVFNDNEAALQWVRNNHSTIPYVRNRVSNIRELSEDMKLLHVASNQNPADLLSRGVSITQFRKKHETFWFKGPPWLTNEQEWPEQKPHVTVGEIVTDLATPTAPAPDYCIDPSRFSSVKRLIAVTRLVFKFLSLKFPTLSLPSPEVYLLKRCQLIQYPTVSAILQPSHSQSETTTLLSQSKKLIRDLGLYLDDDGLIRSYGRIQHSLYHSENLILLPPKSWLARLFILQAHEAVNHGGMSETLSEVRHQFWLPKGRQTVKTIIRECYHCRRTQAKAHSPPGPPPLPAERVNFHRPFESVGVDFTGAISIRDEITRDIVKVYVCLFTCASTRAVHLELANDLTATTFISVFRRFCARFSTPSLIISDNGSNFKATSQFLRSLSEEPSVKEYLAGHKISWRFIPPRTPSMGGFYERLVGVVKSCLRKTLFKRTVGWNDLVTILLEVEQIVNNRPLTYMESELPDLRPLTPNHLLKGGAVRIMPPVVTSDRLDPLYLLDHRSLNEQYNRLSEAVAHFSKTWATDYIASLREKHYGNAKAQQSNSVTKGDVVLIVSDLPRSEWPLGRITNVFPDSDGVIRTVEVHFQGHHHVRTIDKLVPLESAPLPEYVDTVPTAPEPEVPGRRPQRLAAQAAASQRRALIATEQL
ncbi:MAG: reverse transcriptase domain-containing protein [Cyanobacteria bacterium J06614_10]